MTETFCTCGGKYKARMLSVTLKHNNVDVTVTQVPGYECLECKDQRFPHKVSKRVREMIRNQAPDSEGNIVYSEE